MKILVNQRNDGVFTIGQNQFINVAPVEIPVETGGKPEQMFSVGIENICFGLYKRHGDALEAFNAIVEFLGESGADTTCYRLPQDKMQAVYRGQGFNGQGKRRPRN